MAVGLLSGDVVGTQRSLAASSGAEFLAANRVDDTVMEPGCSGDYDFPFFSQETALLIVLWACFIVLAALRVHVLRDRKDDILGNRTLKFSKIVSDRAR